MRAVVLQFSNISIAIKTITTANALSPVSHIGAYTCNGFQKNFQANSYGLAIISFALSGSSHSLRNDFVGKNYTTALQAAIKNHRRRDKED